MAVPQLVLGAFNLTDWLGVTYNTHVIAEGTSKGAPVPLEVAVQSWLQDGSVVVTQGYDNRTVTLRVKFRGPSLTAVAQAEAAFFAELGKPNTLTWTPASGPASVFVVVTSSMEEAPSQDGDLAEMQAFPWRTYNVRLLCEAFTRSATAFTSTGVAPGGSTTTTLDTCGATTGWTGTIDGVSSTVVFSSGPPTNVAISGSVGGGIHSGTMQKTFAATTTSTNLLMVDWLGASTSVLSAVGDGVTLVKFAESGSPTAGYTRTWFKVAASSLAVTSFTARSSNGLAVALAIDNVAVTNVSPAYGTNRQQLRSLDVPGSARLPGSLAIESATAALGDALVYVYPTTAATTSYSPPMRQYRVSGNTVTPDSTKISGNTEPLTGSVVSFQMPIAACPVGTYLLLGRLATSGGGTPTITFTGKTVIGGTASGSVTNTRAIVTTTAYQTFALGRLQLPTIDLDAAATTASVLVQLDVSASSTCTFDEFWLFNTSIGNLVSVACGTGAGTLGGSSRRLYIEPATTTTPRPTVRVGHNSDRSDSHYPVGAVSAWQAPQFLPSQSSVLVVTSNATDAVVNLSGYARWHTNASS